MNMAPTTITKTGEPFDRSALEQLLRRRFFYTGAFEIYGGVAGLFDYGPPLCALQANFIDLWRKFFVIEEGMLELEPTILTPSEVLKTSGHVDKFADWCCKDPKTGEIFRADHLIEGVLEARLKGDLEARGALDINADTGAEEDPKKKKKIKAKAAAVKIDEATKQEYEKILAQIDNFDGPALAKIMKEHNIKNPTSGGDLLDPVEFNLMFQTSIGPTAQLVGYLRPETAQGQFLNFAKALEFNNQQMPFATASIGKSFRNEISPRAGLLRVREFLMAEIEHFVDPDGGKEHPRFEEVAHVELELLNRETQLAGKTDVVRTPIGEAVKKGIVNNSSLGYFLARIQMFMEKIGVDQKKVRFRQHMANEMAHYAADCWDCELLNSYGWIECVGCADRAANDLSVHSKATKQQLLVRESRKEPLRIEEWVCELDKKKFGPRFKKDGKAVEQAINDLSQELREKLSVELKEQGKVEIPVEGTSLANGKAELTKDILVIEKKTRVENIREYFPHVIEPSFGIGRILYSLIEHNYWTRPGDESRGVISFPPIVAPTKVLLVPLSNHDTLQPMVRRLGQRLRQLGISNRVDDSGASIGKR
jgi:glycyl-tRNA synthetase